MGAVVLTGSTSGSVTLDPPAVAGSTVITLPSTSGTMAKLTDIPAAQWTTSGSDIYYSTGNVGIGNSSMGSFNSGYNNLVVGSGTGNEGLAIYAGSASSCYLGFKGTASTTAQGLFEYDCSANTLYTYTNGALRSTLDSNGNFLLSGLTSPISSGRLCIAENLTTYNPIVLKDTQSATYSGIGYMLFTNSSNAEAGKIAHTGSTTVAYVTSSDYRLKQNIAPMVGALNKVALLKPVTYNWKDDNSAGQGFIAHELQSVVPECVVGEKDEVNEDGSIKAQGIDTSFLVATLTAAIQEQQALIENLTTRLSALENK